LHRPGWLKTYAFYSAEQDEWLIGAIRRGDPADGHLIGYEREKPRAEASTRIGVPMLAEASAVSLQAYQNTDLRCTLARRCPPTPRRSLSASTPIK
jgi:hypothetical protein